MPTHPRRNRAFHSQIRRRLSSERLEPRQLMAAYINEIHFDPLFGTPDEDQYIELRGLPGERLSPGTYFVAIGGADGVHELGDIHTIFDLSNHTFGSNGIMVIMESGGQYAVDASAKLFKGTDGFKGIPDVPFLADSTNKRMRTGSNTFLLIRTNVAPKLTDDIDSNDDGQPEGAYLNWTILDGVGVFPWVESVFKQQSYAPIVFRERAVGGGMPGATLVDTDSLAYVGRIGQSTGYLSGDWVAGNTVEFDDKSGSPSWRFQLQHGVFGTPRPFSYGGRFLDHVGSSNWVGSIAGSIFRDDNSDGIQQASEPPISGIQVTSDLNGDTLPGYFTELIEPNNYVSGSDVTNISSNVTLVTAGSNNNHQSFKTRTQQLFGAPAGELVFSSEGVNFYNDSARLRMDFYRPAKSVSIDAIGDSNLSSTYGRLEIYNSAGQSLGFVRTAALGSGVRQRLSISSSGDDIAYAVAYSDNGFLNSSPFGRFDSLAITLREQTAISGEDGKYMLEHVTRGSYVVRADRGAYDLVFPAGTGTHSVTIDKYQAIANRNFGLLGNLPPSLDDQSYNVSEGISSGSPIAILPIKRGYPSQSLKATILSGDSQGLFRIDPSTRELILQGRLDFESRSSFALNVKIEDSVNAALNDTALIQIVVQDANEPPLVDQQVKSIPENSAALTIVTTAKAVDQDSGQAGQYTWSIVAGNVDNAFAIDAVSGVITVVDGSKLNFESRSSYDLKVRATDKGSPVQFGEAIILVTVTDINEAPILDDKFLSIDERRPPGSIVGTLVARDPDANQTHNWQIVGGSGAALFQIGASSGELSVATGSSLDFESTSSFDLAIKVTDSGTPALTNSRTYTINIADINEPPVIGNAVFQIAENSAPDSVVGVISGTDEDAGQTLAFSISGGDSGKFVIDAATGQLKVAQGAILDFESNPNLSFSVTARDNGPTPQSQTTTVTISLSNVNEPPGVITNVMSVPENSVAGYLGGRIEVTDPDVGDQLRFEIIEQTRNWMAVDAVLGDLTVLAGATIDFEGANQDIVKVRVTDSAGLAAIGTITIQASNVNDPPVSARPLANVAASAGQTFTYAIPNDAFTDQDVGDTRRYFATTNTGFPIPSWLTFNGTTGVLGGTPTLNDAGTLRLKFTAIDAAGASASTELVVDVQASPFPLHNAQKPTDVNNNNSVTALDALLVINHINSIGSTSVLPGTDPRGAWLDVNGDNSISGIDALLIINELNRGSGEGEFESWAWDYYQRDDEEQEADYLF